MVGDYPDEPIAISHYSGLYNLKLGIKQITIDQFEAPPMLETLDRLPQIIRFLIALPIILFLFWLSSQIVRFFDKSPEWLRWILFLPVSFFFTVLVITLCMFINWNLFQYIQPIIVMLATAFTLHIFAPRWKSGFALASILLRGIIIIFFFSIILASEQGFNKTSRFELLREIPAWVITIWVYFHFLRKPKNASPA